MNDTQILNSKFEKFILKSDISTAIEMKYLPIGWSEDSLEVIRHKEYHGVFTQFTNALQFVGEELDYIYNNFKINGLNANLYILKYSLKTIDHLDSNNSETLWNLDYIGLADYNTLKVKDGKLSINFNSNKLEELIKSHQSDIFELERLTSIDDDNIAPLTLNKTEIKGRTLISNGFNQLLSQLEGQTESIVFQQFSLASANEGYGGATSISEVVKKAFDRQSSTDVNAVPYNNFIYGAETPSNMFIVDDQIATGEILKVDLSIVLDLSVQRTGVPINGGALYIELKKIEYSETNNNYTIIESVEIGSMGVSSITEYGHFEIQHSFELNYNQGCILHYSYRKASSVVGVSTCKVSLFKEDITIKGDSVVAGSYDISCLFVHDCFERLMYILTGKQNKFYSKLFGRTNIGYKNDGDYGLIALTCGFWLRAFSKDAEKYKSLQTSVKQLYESLKTVFNVGATIEDINLTQRFRIEDLRYFYRNKTVLDLGEVWDYEESIDPKGFFSGIELGYNKGGDYENEVGLDEPNTVTNWITPIRKTDNKYNSLSDIRSDEYGMEITRRKIYKLYPDEDTSMDDHNWFLDLKRVDGLSSYTQKDWEDRLESEPLGILSPETYRSFLFTPLRILFRHGWIIRSGLEQKINLLKKLKYINSKANSNLETHFIGETESFKENSDLLVSKLTRPRFLPITIKFKANLNDEIINKIFGETKDLESGTTELIKNFYFKYQWKYNGEIQRGYLMGFKPKTGDFEMLKTNEAIL